MGEAELLASCYENAMRLANDYGLRLLAFPSISTGIYRFPIEKACKIAFDFMLEALQDITRIEQIVFCTFSAGDFSIDQRELHLRKELAGQI